MTDKALIEEATSLQAQIDALQDQHEADLAGMGALLTIIRRLEKQVEDLQAQVGGLANPLANLIKP